MTLEVYPNDNRSRPHTKVIVDTTALGANSSTSQKAVVVFGSAQGGKPGEFYKLTSYAQAKSIFKGGELLDFIEIAWHPSDVVQGAGIIYAMRVDSATQATLTQGNLLFSSYQYGSGANSVSIKLEDGTLGGSHKLTAYDNISMSTEVYDNLGIIFQVSTTNAPAFETLEVTNGNLIIKKGNDKETATVVANISLKSVASVNALVTQLSLLDGIQAQIVPYGDKNIDPSTITDMAATDIKSGTANVNALAGDIANQLQYSSLVTAHVQATGTAVDNFGMATLVGGTDGTVPASWAPFFDKLRTEDIPYAYYVVPLSPVQTIHSELSSVITDLTTSGYPMRAIVGGALGETIQYTLTRKSVLYSSRVTLLGDDYQVKMADNRIVALPAYMATAFVAGIASGLPQGVAITYKTLRIIKSLRSYTSDQLDQMYNSGVVVAEKVRNVVTSFRFIGDPTTMNDVNDPVSSKMSLGESTDFLVSELRTNLDNSFIGTSSSSTTANDVKIAVSSFLLVKKNANEIQDYDSSDIVASLLGNTINVAFTVIPAREVEKIIVTMTYNSATQTA